MGAVGHGTRGNGIIVHKKHLLRGGRSRQFGEGLQREVWRIDGPHLNRALKAPVHLLLHDETLYIRCLGQAAASSRWT